MGSTTLNPDAVVLGTANAAGIYVAPVGTTLPTDAGSALDPAFTTLGYLSDDGVSLGADTTSEDIRAWQSKAPVRTVITEKTLTLGFQMIEFSPATTALYFDQDLPVEQSGAFALEVRSDGGGKQYAVVIDTRDGDVLVRYCFPRATLSSNEDIEIVAGSAQGLGVELKALDDAGTMARIYKGLAVPAVGGQNKGNATPGSTYTAEATITASDPTNAAKLTGLGFIANPQTAWTTDQKITVGTFDFHWDGDSWVEGAAA